MKKLLALAGTILLVVLNIVQIRLNNKEKANIQETGIATIDSIASGNCGGSGHGSSESV